VFELANTFRALDSAAIVIGQAYCLISPQGPMNAFAGDKNFHSLSSIVTHQLYQNTHNTTKIPDNVTEILFVL
jgi:hypothetical protein